MKTLLLIAFILFPSVWTAWADGTPAVPASQAEVNSGANKVKYVTPATLKNWIGGGTGPTNGTTAAQVTNIVQSMAVTNSQPVVGVGNVTLNGAIPLVATNISRHQGLLISYQNSLAPGVPDNWMLFDVIGGGSIDIFTNGTIGAVTAIGSSVIANANGTASISDSGGHSLVLSNGVAYLNGLPLLTSAAGLIVYSNSPNIVWSSSAYPESDWTTNANFSSLAIGTPALGSYSILVITNSSATSFVTNSYPFSAFSLFAGAGTTTGVIPPAQIVKFVFANGGNGITVAEYGQDNTNLVALSKGNARGLTNYVAGETLVTNQLLKFDGGLHSGSLRDVTFFPSFVGANGSWSIYCSNVVLNTLAGYTWLANSNNRVTNGVIAFTSYGGTNSYLLKAMIKEQ